MITGWYILKSEWPSQIPFLNIYDEITTIFSLRYDIINKKIEIILKNYSEVVNYSYLAQNTWFIIKIQLILGENVGSSSDSIRVLIVNYPLS